MSGQQDLLNPEHNDIKTGLAEFGSGQLQKGKFSQEKGHNVLTKK